MKNFQAPPTHLNPLPTYEPWDPLPKPFYRLAAELPAPALRVALSLIELTCGWHRHEVQVAASVLAVLSGLSDRQVRTGLAQLREKGLLLERDGRAGMKVYSLIPALQVARKGEQHVTRSSWGQEAPPGLPPEDMFRGKAEHFFRHDQEDHVNKTKDIQQHVRRPTAPTSPSPPEPVHDVAGEGDPDRITTLIGRLHREAGIGRWKATQLARSYPAQVINQVLEAIPIRREVVHNLPGWVVCEIERGGYEIPQDLARVHADGLNRFKARKERAPIPVVNRSSDCEEASVAVEESPAQPEAVHSEIDAVAEALARLTDPVRRDMLNQVEERVRALTPRWARRLEAEDALHCPLARVQLLELLAC